MAVKLRLKRFGRMNHPTYRLCAADIRAPRDGRIIESLGYYLPKAKKADEQVSLKAERVQYWLSVGAQMSETAESLIKRSGIELPKKKPRKPRNRKAKPFTPPKRRTKAKAAASSGPAEG